MKLAATSILALALAAPAVTAQTTEDRPSSTTMSTKKDTASPPDKTQPQAGTASGSSTSDRGSLSTSSSATTKDRSISASTDATTDDKCKCDCSQQGTTKMRSKRGASGRSAPDSSMRRPSSTDTTAPRDLDRDTSASGSATSTTGSSSSTTGSSAGSTTGSSIDQARPAAPSTGPVDSTHTGSTTDTSKPPGTGDGTMKPTDSSNSSTQPSDPNAPKK
ncbi:MAG TPA: hypothetical protein VKC58_14660 [Myxococcales bacterium]|nr:hypothetical protein [Myxococcales bacterium]